MRATCGVGVPVSWSKPRSRSRDSWQTFGHVCPAIDSPHLGHLWAALSSDGAGQQRWLESMPRRALDVEWLGAWVKEKRSRRHSPRTVDSRLQQQILGEEWSARQTDKVRKREGREGWEKGFVESAADGEGPMGRTCSDTSHIARPPSSCTFCLGHLSARRSEARQSGSS